MKKKLICILLACTICCCSACGKTEETQIEKEDTNKATVTDEEAVSESETNDTEASYETETKNDSLSEDQPGLAEEAHSGEITIEMTTTEDKIRAEDGTVLLIKTCSYPVVSIEGNEEASAKINASIQDIVASFASDTDTILGYAKDHYQSLLDDGYDSFIEYSEDLSFVATRCDSNVISFASTTYSYIGGAHGSSGSYSINYNTTTGAEIAFTDLSDNPEQFHTDTLAYLQELASSESYADRFYSPETATSQELEDVLYADHTWYLSDSGLVFVSDPYLLGPYAAGTITFLIPYQELSHMGLREEYSYTGNFVMELQDGDSYTLDINGDNSEDTIHFYSESTYNKESGEYASYTHLYINDTDLTSGDDPELIETFHQYAWGGYALYDMDASDETIELVFYSFEEADGEYDTYSHLYRYDKEGVLTYLGKLKGNVCSPLSDLSALAP